MANLLPTDDVKPGCCIRCGRGPLTGPGLFYEVVGFEEVRSMGGANKIVARERTGRIACAACIHSIKSGVAVGQPRLGV